VRRGLVAAIAVLVVLAALVGWAAWSADDADDPVRVLLVGDSLVLQAAPYWDELMAETGAEVRQYSYAGTNTCDWFGQMERQRDEFDPHVVAWSFGGNDATACMRREDGSQFTQPELLAKYRADTRRALDIWDDDVSIYLVSPPAMYDGDNRFAPTYRAFADEEPNVTFVDGGRFITPGRDWRRVGECLPDEAECTGPVVDGVRTNVLRSPDRVHFCPVEIGPSERCPTYSSGAYRFARNIADPIRRGET
jgi:hypothetical protein